MITKYQNLLVSLLYYCKYYYLNTKYNYSLLLQKKWFMSTMSKRFIFFNPLDIGNQLISNPIFASNGGIIILRIDNLYADKGGYTTGSKNNILVTFLKLPLPLLIVLINQKCLFKWHFLKMIKKVISKTLLN